MTTMVALFTSVPVPAVLQWKSEGNTSHQQSSKKAVTTFFSTRPNLLLQIVKGAWNSNRDSLACHRGLIRCKADSSRNPDGGEAWVADNDAVVRGMPLLLGWVSLVAVLLNRSLSGIAPVADASSAQSRADVLTFALAATVLLTGLVWESIQPKSVVAVEMEGVECFRLASGLPADAAQELQWVWDALRSATRAQTLVVVYGNNCVLQAGLAAELGDSGTISVNASQLFTGSLCQVVRASGKQSYLANLALYPGRCELPFLPSNTQAVIIQGIGDDGVMIVASNTIRGFTANDQAWIAIIGDKLDTTLEKWAPAKGSWNTPEPQVLL